MGFISVDALVFESLVDINQVFNYDQLLWWLTLIYLFTKSSSFFTNGNFDEVNADGSVKVMNERKMKCDWKGDTANE